MDGSKKVKSRGKAALIIGSSFLGVLIPCVLAGIFIVIKFLDLDMDRSAELKFIFLLVFASIFSSVFSWALWLVIGRLIFGGEQFYKYIDESSFSIFSPGSIPSEKAAPFVQKYDNLVRTVLGVNGSGDTKASD